MEKTPTYLEMRNLHMKCYKCSSKRPNNRVVTGTTLEVRRKQIKYTKRKPYTNEKRDHLKIEWSNNTNISKQIEDIT